MLFKVRFLGLIVIAAVAGVWPMTAYAAPTPPGLGAAAGFAVLSTTPLPGGGAVACTDGTITGNVGSTGAMASWVPVRCPVTGTITAPVSSQVVTGFNNAYAGYVTIPCGTTLTGTLAGRTLTPGVYCFDAAAALTGVLTLSGPSNGTWIFKIGTVPAGGALTGTGFTVLMAGGAPPCSVNWWSNAAMTFTDSFLIGTILSGAAITMTRGTLHGNALAKAAVSITGTAVTGCTAAGGGVPGPGCEDENRDGGQTGHHTGQHADGDNEGCESEDSHQSGDGDHKAKDEAKVETKSTDTHKSADAHKSTVKIAVKSKSDSNSKSEGKND